MTKWNYTRVARWQGVERTPATRPLTSREITLRPQSIAEQHRMDFLRRRLGRLGQEELCAVDTTSRSAYGDSLADIRWEKDKERLPLEQTGAAIVYTLWQHLPVYYRTFPGNIPDSNGPSDVSCTVTGQ